MGVGGLRLNFKASLYQRKSTWEALPVCEIMARLGRIPDTRLETGLDAVWLTCWAETPEGRALFPWLDVEAPGEAHKDREANLAAGRELYKRLAEAGLDDGLVVLLTGRGLRFCWPWAVPTHNAPSFRAMLADAASWPGIDACPYASGVPLFLAGFRGNRRQGAKGPWTTARITHAELLTLDAAAYDSMVTAKPSAAAIREVVAAILPVGWMPEAWADALEPYKWAQRLGANIIKPNFPPRAEAKRITLAAVRAALDARGTEFRERQVGEAEMLQLMECPSCGRKWKAWATSAGRLKCWSSGCEAGAVALDLKGQAFRPGLPASAWLPEVRGEAVEAEREEVARVELEEARRLVREAVASGDDVLVSASPGVGKTHSSVEAALALAAEGELVLLTVPSRALAAEIESKAVEMARERGLFDLEEPPLIRRLEGRTPKNCPAYDLVKSYTRRGYSPALLKCRGGCVHSDSCEYQTQFEGLGSGGGLLVSSHAQTPFIKKALERAAVWIVDEAGSAPAALVKREVVRDGALDAIQARLPVGSAEIISKLKAGAETLLRRTVEASQAEKPHARRFVQGRAYATAPPTELEGTVGLWELARVTLEEREALARDLAVFLPLEGEKPGAWQRRLYFAAVDLAALRWLWAALGEEEGLGAVAFTQASTSTKRPIKFISVRRDVPEFAGRIVALDGTPDRAEVESLFGRTFNEVSASVAPRPGRRVWIRRGLGKMKAAGLSEEALAERLGKAVRHLRPGDRRVLIVTHLAVEADVVELARRLDPSREWGVAHFWASKGTNAFQDFDAVVSFGTPTASPGGTLDLGMALFTSEEERKAWLSRLGERDLAQALHRVRPILAARTIIVLGNTWPAESLGKPSFTLDGQKGMAAASSSEKEAVRRLVALARRFHWVGLDMAAVAGVFFGQGVTEEVSAWSRLLAPPVTRFRMVPTLIEEVLITVGTIQNGVSAPPVPVLFEKDRAKVLPLLLRKVAEETGLPLLEYRPTGGRGSKGQLAVGTVAAVRAWFEEFRAELPPFRAVEWQGEEEFQAAFLSPALAPDPASPLEEPSLYEEFMASDNEAEVSEIYGSTPPPEEESQPESGQADAEYMLEMLRERFLALGELLSEVTDAPAEIVPGFNPFDTEATSV